MKFKKFLKRSISFFLIVLCFCLFFSLFLIIDASRINLNTNKLANNNENLVFYDTNNNIIAESSILKGSKINDQLPDHVYNSFIAIEDQHFYTHKGIDYKRIVGASISNLKSFSFKEGASTITQQLVKNTQLSSEKTLFRKVRELKLAKDVEKKYSKQEILDMYLNAIYFGNGCYGIESASRVYFNKSASELTLNESATFSALIKAPSKLSPISNPDDLNTRKDIVLKKLKEQNKISEQEFNNNYNKKFVLNINKINTFKADDYINLAIEEVSEKLNIETKHLMSQEYNIYTYMDSEIQNTVSNELSNGAINLNFHKYDSATVVIDNTTHGISGISVKSNFNIKTLKRSPGSLIKPILVYAPAIEYNYISPATLFLDEKTDFEGYSPSNYKNIYNGYVSTRYSIANSLNVPAVKILNMVGLQKSKTFAQKAGIKFNNQDTGLGVALGGFNEGTTFLDIAGSYIPFSNGGNYKAPQFIKKITDKNNKTLYEDANIKNQIMSQETAYLITDMLKSTIDSGTGKKLKEIDIISCAKTGTVGNADFNTDAYTAAYTSNHTFCTWIGSTGTENLPNTITGGNQPCTVTAKIMSTVYANNKPSDFVRPENIISCNIDLICLNKYQTIKLAHEITPERYIVKDIFNKKNAPSEISELFYNPQVNDLKITVKDESININFSANDYLSYKIERIDSNTEIPKLIAEIKRKNGSINISDTNVTGGKVYQYILTPYFEISKNNEVQTGTPFTSEKCMLPYNFTPSTPDDYDWWKGYDKTFY